MKFATWNIYWFGDPTRMHRTEQDEELIAMIIDNLSPDVFALQEIVDVEALARVLQKVESRRYVVRATDGTWLSSASNPTKEKKLQKIVLCIDADAIEFVCGGPLSMKAARKPFAADLRHRGSGELFTVVAVHLKSGQPEFLDAASADKRRKEAEALAKWLQGDAAATTAKMPKPGSASVVVLGDFNATIDDPNDSLRPLRNGALAAWNWRLPQADAGQSNTAIDDGYVIDFIMLSPTMTERVEHAPHIYAYDFDPDLGGPNAFHAGSDGSGRLLDYRASDHRPVLCRLREA